MEEVGTGSMGSLLDETVEQRARIAEFFSSFFRGPRTDELLSAFPSVEASLGAILDALGIPSGEAEEPHPPLVAGTPLEAEFAKLFYGVGDRNVPLSESVWTNEFGLMCQESFAGMRALYARKGFAPAPGASQEADTLPLELAFGAILMRSGDREGERELFLGHASPLAKSVADAALGKACTSLTKPVFHALKRFAVAEETLLAGCRMHQRNA